MDVTEGKVVTCKAAVFYDPKSPFKVETIKVLPPTPGHVRVKMVATSLCHTDLGYFDGSFPAQKLPFVAGHEGAGIVESVGEGVKSVKIGDKVFTLFFQHCGECPLCSSKKTNLCIDIKRKVPLLGPFLRAEGLDGLTSFTTLEGKILYHSFGASAFSEYTVVPENSCVKVNPETNLKKACIMACGFLTGYGSSVNTVNIQPGDKVAVWGLGGVGLACVIGCKEKRAGKIIGIAVTEDKQAIAEKHGCTDFIALSTLEKDTTIVEKLKQLTTFGVDYAFVCVGSSKPLEDAINSTAVGGTIVMVGLTTFGETTTFVTNELLTGKKITGAIYGDYQIFEDVAKVVDRVVESKLQLDDFITSNFKLDEINEAVTLMRQGKSIRSVIQF